MKKTFKRAIGLIVCFGIFMFAFNAEAFAESSDLEKASCDHRSNENSNKTIQKSLFDKDEIEHLKNLSQENPQLLEQIGGAEQEEIILTVVCIICATIVLVVVIKAL